MLGVVSQQRASEREEPSNALIGDAVTNGPTLAMTVYEPAPPQTREVIGDLRLRLPHRGHQLTHRELTAGLKQLQDAHSRRIPQPTEVLRDKVSLGRGVRQNKRGSGDLGHPTKVSEFADVS